MCAEPRDEPGVGPAGAQVIQILDDTVEWYRALGTQQQNATQPSDLLILFANRQTADKVVSLAFDIARANAELLSSEAGSRPRARWRTIAVALTQQQAQLDRERQAIQQEMAADRAKAAAGGKGRARMRGEAAELQGELAMVDARRNLLDTMTEFVNGSDPKAANANALKAQIDAIAATVPGAGLRSPRRQRHRRAPAVTSSQRRPQPLPRPRRACRHLGSGRPRCCTSTTRSAPSRRWISVPPALADTFHNISAAPLAQLQKYSARSAALAAQADHADRRC